jgi:hypothetical protein
MVTGFNTDIRFNNVVYHVQTETRKDAGIETTVYIRGAVIHSLKTSYRKQASASDFSDDKLKRLLEDQHRHVIAKIRGGRITLPASPAAPA